MLPLLAVGIYTTTLLTTGCGDDGSTEEDNGKLEFVEKNGTIFRNKTVNLGEKL